MPIAQSWQQPSRYAGGPARTGTVFTCPLWIAGGPPSVDLRQLDAAVQDLRGEIPTDVLLPNFVMELPEALRLHKQLMENVFRHSPHSWKDAGLQYAKSLGKRIGNTHLLYEFGIKPLAGDIVKLAKLNSRVSARIKHLSTIPTGDYVKWRRRISVDQSGSIGFGVSPFVRFVSSTVTANVTVELFARIKRTRTVSSATDRLRATLDASGVSQFGSVLWEAIPFSFVADWFYPCGRTLDALNVQAFTGCLANQNLGYQSHTEAVLSCRGLVPSPGTAWYDSNKFEYARCTVRYYNRSGGLPSTRTAVNYGVRQALLSGSLVLQRA